MQQQQQNNDVLVFNRGQEANLVTTLNAILDAIFIAIEIGMKMTAFGYKINRLCWLYGIFGWLPPSAFEEFQQQCVWLKV